MVKKTYPYKAHYLLAVRWRFVLKKLRSRREYSHRWNPCKMSAFSIYESERTHITGLTLQEQWELVNIPYCLGRVPLLDSRSCDISLRALEWLGRESLMRLFAGCICCPWAKMWNQCVDMLDTVVGGGPGLTRWKRLFVGSYIRKAAARRGSRPIDETGLNSSIIDAYCNSQTRHAKPAILRKNGYQIYFHLIYKHSRYSQCYLVVTLLRLRIANYNVSHSLDNV